MNKNHFSVVILLAAALLWGLPFPASAQQTRTAAEVKINEKALWQNKTFTRYTYEEDIKDTLRAVARLAGLPITFSEGIADTITMEFKDMPLKDAFDFLINQYNLDYKLGPQSMHVFKPGQTQDALIPLENVSVSEAQSTIERFGLMKKEVKAVFDPASKTIFVTASPREIANIQRVIMALEAAKKKEMTARPEIRYFPLRYAKVNDIEIRIGKSSVMVKGLVNVLTDILGLTRVGEKTTLKRDSGVADITRAGEKSTTTASRAIERRLGVITQKATEPPADTQEAGGEDKKGMLVAEAGTITSDPRTNRIIIRDYPEKLDEYAKIIEQFDKPTKMIKIDVIIVAATKDFARELGIGITGRKEKADSAEKSRRYDSSSSIPSREAFDELVDNPPAQLITLDPILRSAAGTAIGPYGLAGTFLYQGVNSTLTATIAMAETKGVGKTINKSSIVTMDNMEAIVQATTTITYKLQTGGEVPTVEDRQIEAGLILHTTPHIIQTEDNKTLVELVISANRSSFLTARTDDIPHEAKANLTTQAVVGDQTTLVFGGFFESTYTSSETGIPCLMNLPGLGYLFKTASAADPKNNLLFFLTPTVISLDKIPYESPRLIREIDGYERELRDIDQEKGKNWIEDGIKKSR